MLWPGSIFAFLLTCYLIWLFVKLRRLTRLKSRLRRDTVKRQLRQRPPSRRSTNRRNWKE